MDQIPIFVRADEINADFPKSDSKDVAVEEPAFICLSKVILSKFLSLTVVHPEQQIEIKQLSRMIFWQVSLMRSSRERLLNLVDMDIPVVDINTLTAEDLRNFGCSSCRLNHDYNFTKNIRLESLDQKTFHKLEMCLSSIRRRTRHVIFLLNSVREALIRNCGESLVNSYFFPPVGMRQALRHQIDDLIIQL